MHFGPESYVIVATYGNARPNQRWASGIRTHEDATALRQGAIEKGFTDAKIWLEKDFQAFLQSQERERTAAQKVARLLARHV